MPNPWEYLNYLGNHPANRQGKLPTLQNGFPTPQPLAGQREVSRPLAGAPSPNVLQTPPPQSSGTGTSLLGPPVTPGTKPPNPTPSPQGTNPKPSNSPLAPQVKPSDGEFYQPKPTGNAAQYAYRPIRFPGVEVSGGSWAKYQDGGFVDYTSEGWRRASGVSFSDAQLSALWKALPDSWKVDIASWDPAIRDAYMNALSNPHVGGVWQGQWMTGQQAAEMIAKQMAQQKDNEMKTIQNDKKRQDKIDKAELQSTYQPRAYFVPR